MSRFLVCLALLVGWQAAAAVAAPNPVTGRVQKVLIHYLDAAGRHTLSPSLYERDAYQAKLRKDPSLCSGLRFEIQWKTSAPASAPLQLRLEIRSSKDPQLMTINETVHRRPWYDRWTRVSLDKAAMDRLGEVVAWRVSLWDGERMVADQRSFLW
jgi:hypothetical protein